MIGKNCSRLLILCVAWIIAGCASNPFTVPVTNTDERIVYAHFSFLPPNGTNWITTNGPEERAFGESTMAMIRFAKPLSQQAPTTPAEAETLAAGATIHIFPEGETISQGMLAQYNQSIWYFPNNHPRYEMTDFEYSFDDSYDTPCVRYDSKAEDKSDPTFPGSIFMFHNWGISCVHPQHKNEIYSLNASQRYLKGEPPTDLSDEFDPHINSMQFQ